MPSHSFSTNRRTLLSGFGTLALGAMLHRDGVARDGAGAPPDGLPHAAPKAKSVIWLFMNGGPSQVDTWDYKPELEKQNGKALTNKPIVELTIGNYRGGEFQVVDVFLLTSSCQTKRHRKAPWRS